MPSASFLIHSFIHLSLHLHSVWLQHGQHPFLCLLLSIWPSTNLSTHALCYFTNLSLALSTQLNPIHQPTLPINHPSFHSPQLLTHHNACSYNCLCQLFNPMSFYFSQPSSEHWPFVGHVQKGVHCTSKHQRIQDVRQVHHCLQHAHEQCANTWQSLFFLKIYINKSFVIHYVSLSYWN